MKNERKSRIYEEALVEILETLSLICMVCSEHEKGYLSSCISDKHYKLESLSKIIKDDLKDDRK